MSYDDDPPLGTRTETTTLTVSSHTLRGRDLADMLEAWETLIRGNLDEAEVTARTLSNGETEITLRRVQRVDP